MKWFMTHDKSWYSDTLDFVIKDPLLGQTLFLTTESLLKVMKNVFYSMLKALFGLDICRFLSWIFGFVE